MPSLPHEGALKDWMPFCNPPIRLGKVEEWELPQSVKMQGKKHFIHSGGTMNGYRFLESRSPISIQMKMSHTFESALLLLGLCPLKLKALTY